jgi:hypothetical protein
MNVPERYVLTDGEIEQRAGLVRRYLDAELKLGHRGHASSHDTERIQD